MFSLLVPTYSHSLKHSVTVSVAVLYFAALGDIFVCVRSNGPILRMGFQTSSSTNSLHKRRLGPRFCIRTSGDRFLWNPMLPARTGLHSGSLDNDSVSSW